MTSSAQASPRDFVGYGRHEPCVRWPNREKLVINLVLNYEEGSEYSKLDGDPHNDAWGEYGTDVVDGPRDLGNETHFEFGSRVGVWRLVRLFDRFAVPVTINACAVALERNPEVASWILERGHDVMGHGWRWREYHAADRQAEVKDLHLAMESFERVLGARPLGWNVRTMPSPNTLEILADEGFVYSSDPANDELPYTVQIGERPILVIPYSHVYNDERYFIAPTYSTSRHFAETLEAAVDYLCEDVDHGAAPRMMTVALHARWSGQASRTAAVRRFLEYIRHRHDVSFMRRIDIANWWLANAGGWSHGRTRTCGS
jgi:peptidoglycan/xylan/chitin deacetylase (PgdA/CDA1 family)